LFMYQTLHKWWNKEMMMMMMMIPAQVWITIKVLIVTYIIKNKTKCNH